jgi:hypothetical protein
MKIMIITLLMTCFIGTRAYGFSGSSFIPSLSVSWWNPLSFVSDTYDWTADLVDSYLADDGEIETEEETGGDSFLTSLYDDTANSWYNLTAFPIQPEMYGSCMATNSNGPACVICRNTGLLAFNDLEHNLMCTLDEDQRKNLDGDDKSKKKYCEGGCLAENKTDEIEINDVLKRATQLRKDLIIKQTFKGWKDVAEETLDIAGNPFLQEGIGDNFLCSAGKFEQLTEMLQKNKGSKCKDTTIEEIKKSIVSYAKQCIQTGGKDCPASLQPGQELPEFGYDIAVGPPTSDGIYPTTQMSLEDDSPLSVIDRLIAPDKRLDRITTTLNQLKRRSLKFLINGQSEMAKSFTNIKVDALDQPRPHQDGYKAVGNLTSQSLYQGSVLVAENTELFSVDNYLANLKKVFDPSFDCKGEQCQSLYTFLEFDPSVGRVLNQAIGDDKNYKQAILKFKDMYRDNAKRDLAKSEYIKRKNLNDIDGLNKKIQELESKNKEEQTDELKEKINDYKNQIIALDTENNARDKIIIKQESFFDQLEANKPIDSEVFRDTALRMQQSRIEELSDKCLNITRSFAKLCQMDNNPKNYSVTGFIGSDLSSNYSIAKKMLDGNYKDQEEKDAKINKIANILDQVSCKEVSDTTSLRTMDNDIVDIVTEEQTDKSCPNPNVNIDETSQNVSGDVNSSSTSSPSFSRNEPVNYSTNTENSLGWNPNDATDQNYCMYTNIDNTDIGVKPNSALVSNPESSANSALNKLRSNEKYSDKISTSSINDLLAAAGGSGIGSLATQSANKNNASEIAEEILIPSEEVSNEIQNVVNNQINNQVVSGITNQQLANIGNDIANDANIKKQTEDIIRNDKAVNKIEQTMEELKTIQANTDSPELKSELDKKLKELQKQIEGLKNQNASLKANRDLDIAKMRNEKIRQQILANNASTREVDVEVASNNNVDTGPRATNNAAIKDSDTGNLNSAGSALNSEFSAPSSDSTDSSFAQNSTDTNTPLNETGLESQGLVLDAKAKKLSNINGEVLALGEDLMIISDDVKTLTNAKALALSKQKQVFVFKGNAYMKQGNDYLLAPKKYNRQRREIANIESIRQIDSLLASLEEDPFSFDEEQSLSVTQLDPEIIVEINKEKKLEEERAKVTNLLISLNNGLN